MAAMYACTGASPSALAIRGLPPESSTGSSPARLADFVDFSTATNHPLYGFLVMKEDDNSDFSAIFGIGDSGGSVPGSGEV
jgi:hypothetical protein